jgi:hypothetical protein
MVKGRIIVVRMFILVIALASAHWPVISAPKPVASTAIPKLAGYSKGTPVQHPAKIADAACSFVSAPAFQKTLASGNYLFAPLSAPSNTNSVTRSRERFTGKIYLVYIYPSHHFW